MANAGVIAPVGLNMVALAAQRHTVPFVVVAGSHKMRPTGYPTDREKKALGVPQKPRWRKSENCPQGTVPTRRTLTSDLQRAESLESFGRRRPPQYTFATNAAAHEVHPLLFGDSKTRLFTYWTGDGFNTTGCYNMICPGFIQVSQDIVLGANITPLSTYNGSQYVIELLVYKNQNL